MSMIEEILHAGMLGIFAFLAPILSTTALAALRVYGAFRPTASDHTKEITLLVAGPIFTLLFVAKSTVAATKDYFSPGVDAEHIFRYGFISLERLCLLAMVCFLVSCVAMIVPRHRGR